MPLPMPPTNKLYFHVGAQQRLTKCVSVLDDVARVLQVDEEYGITCLQVDHAIDALVKAQHVLAILLRAKSEQPKPKVTARRRVSRAKKRNVERSC